MSSSSIPNLWRRHHLLGVLISSNLKRQNKNSLLGHLWWLLDPILMTAVYYVVVAVIFNRGGANQPYILFLVCGLLPWKAFSDSVSQSINSVNSAAGIIKAISFPKAVLPLSLVFSNAIYFFFALVVVVFLSLLYGAKYGTWPNLYYLALPLVVVLQVLFTIGLSLLMGTLGLFFTDTKNIMTHVLKMWYFLSPGLYDVSRIPEALRPWFKLNPLCGIMTSYRDIFMKGRMPSGIDLGYVFLAGIVSCLIGYAVFRRYEGRFVQRL